jgi:hypothetical protein
VYENLDIPLSYRDIKKSERESMVCDILDKFAIVGKKDLFASGAVQGEHARSGTPVSVSSSTGLPWSLA